MKTNKTMRVLGVAAALASITTIGVGGAASASAPAKGDGATILMKGNDRPRFEGPETILAGDDLTIVNRSKPNQIGPHTFSLVEKSELPDTRGKIRRCAKIKLICKDIAEAHEVDPKTFEVGQPNVDNGLEGWDLSFDGDIAGDTWYTETKDESAVRTVTAGEGNLRFLCIVHPDMQGKIKVLPAR